MGAKNEELRIHHLEREESVSINTPLLASVWQWDRGRGEGGAGHMRRISVHVWVCIALCSLSWGLGATQPQPIHKNEIYPPGLSRFSLLPTSPAILHRHVVEDGFFLSSNLTND